MAPRSLMTCGVISAGSSLMCLCSCAQGAPPPSPAFDAAGYNTSMYAWKSGAYNTGYWNGMRVCGFKFSCAQHLSCRLPAICEQHIKTCETKLEQVAATASTATNGSRMAATQRTTVPAAPMTPLGTSGIFILHPPSADP